MDSARSQEEMQIDASSPCALPSNSLSLIALDSEELFLLPCYCPGIIAAFTCAYHVFSASLGGDVAEQCLLFAGEGLARDDSGILGCSRALRMPPPTSLQLVSSQASDILNLFLGIDRCTASSAVALVFTCHGFFFWLHVPGCEN